MIVRDCTGVPVHDCSFTWMSFEPSRRLVDRPVSSTGLRKVLELAMTSTRVRSTVQGVKCGAVPPVNSTTMTTGGSGWRGTFLAVSCTLLGTCTSGWEGSVRAWHFKALTLNFNWYTSRVTGHWTSSVYFTFGSKPFRCYFFTFTLLYFTLLYFTLLYVYFTLLYFTSLHFTLLYFTSLYFTLLYFTLLYVSLLYFTSLHFTSLYFTLFYFTLLYSTSLHFTLLHFTLLYFYFYFTLLYFTFTLLFKFNREIISRSTRQSNKLRLPRVRTESAKKAFYYHGSLVYNMFN